MTDNDLQLLAKSEALINIAEFCSQKCQIHAYKQENTKNILLRDTWYNYSIKSLDEAVNIISKMEDESMKINLGSKVQDLRKHMDTAPWL